MPDGLCGSLEGVAPIDLAGRDIHVYQDLGQMFDRGCGGVCGRHGWPGGPLAPVRHCGMPCGEARVVHVI